MKRIKIGQLGVGHMHAHKIKTLRQFSDVFDVVGVAEDDRRPVADIHDARVVVEMIQGIYASPLSGGGVNFPLADRTHPLVANPSS